MGVQIPVGRGKFLGENRRPIVKYRDTLRSSVQKRLNEPTGMPFGLWARMRQTNEPISAAGGLKFTILWGHVGEVQIFFDCRYVP